MPDLAKNVMRRAYHGTDRLDFTRFDMSHVGPFNVGLHFGTEAAARSRLAYLREENPSANFRILACELTLENPLRVDDVFGHSYAGLFDILEHEINKALPASAPLRRKFDVLFRRWMNADDNPRFARDPSLYAAFNLKLNTELRRLFQKLGYDGFVYRNEIESAAESADSYVVFGGRLVAIVGEASVGSRVPRARDSSCRAA